MLNAIVVIGSIQGLTILTHLLRSKIVALLVGPEGVGIISVVDQFVLIVAQVSSFSLPFAVLKYLSQARSDTPEIFARTYLNLKNALIFATCTGSAIAIAVVTFAPEGMRSDLFSYQAILLLALVTAPTLPLRGFFSNALAAAERPQSAALMMFLAAILSLLGAYCGIFVAGILGFYWANLVTGIAIVAGMGIVSKRLLGIFSPCSSIGVLDEIRRRPEIIRFGLIFSVISFTEPAAFFIARFSLLVNHGETMAGLLQASMAVGLVLTMVLTPANSLLLMPTVAGNIPADQKFLQVNSFQRMLMLILAIGATPLVLFPKAILVVLFSSSFEAASPYLFAFVISELMQILSGIYRSVLMGFNDLVAHLTISLLGHVCFAGISWLLAPDYGIAGIAMAFIVGNFLILVSSAVRLRIVHRFRLKAGSACFAAYLIFGLGGMGAMANLYDDFDVNILIAKSATGLFFVATVFLFLNEQERSSVYRLVAGPYLKRA